MRKYDETSIESIVNFAEKLRNKTLLEAVSKKYRKKLVKEVKNQNKSGNKGRFGDLVEQYYFELDVADRNKPRPDFPKAKLELKTAGLKIDKEGNFKKKEGRLSLSSINFKKIINEEFNSSSFIKKNRNLLIIFYLYQENLHVAESKIIFMGLYELKNNDYKKIKDDWEKIKKAVEEGEAHKLGSRHGWNTLNLEASTSGGKSETNFVQQPKSTIEAHKRRFAYKLRFWEKIIEEITSKDASNQVIENWNLIYNIFSSFFSKTVSEICTELGYTLGGGKNKYSNLTKEIISKKGDLASNKDFLISIGSNNAKEDSIIFRTIRLSDNNKLEQAVSLPAFKATKLKNIEWTESEFLSYLKKPFIFVIFKNSNKNELVFHDIKYYLMNKEDIKKAREVWLDTKMKIGLNRKDYIKISDDMSFHVRPHDQKRGGKDSFWLNKNFVEKIIA